MNAALISLWNLTQEHPGTGGATAAVHILLGFYNSARFPVPLHLLRSFDSNNLAAALTVIERAARGTAELHTVLNNITGRTDFGLRFEQLAYDYKLKGRAKKAHLAPFAPPSMVLRTAPTAAHA